MVFKIVNCGIENDECVVRTAPIPRDIAVGYGEILLALSVTLVYGPALPLLYFMAAAGFGMRYWVEKWAVRH